jgi:signal transduction histidine kinase
MGIVQSGLPLALSMPFILATWIAFMHGHRAITRHDTTLSQTFESGQVDPADFRLTAASVDLEAALRDAVGTVAAVGRSRWVRIELAVDAAMTLPVDPNAFRMALRDSLLLAIDNATGGQVLVTAAALGSQLHIRITDDGPGIDQQVREASMRMGEALIALQGGSIAVEAQPGRGTTVTIRLPMPVTAEHQASGLVQLPVLANHAA